MRNLAPSDGKVFCPTAHCSAFSLIPDQRRSKQNFLIKIINSICLDGTSHLEYYVTTTVKQGSRRIFICILLIRGTLAELQKIKPKKYYLHIQDFREQY